MCQSNKLMYSELDSKRFGYIIYRGLTNEVNPRQIMSMVLLNEIDIAILRFPSENIGQLTRLNDTGIPYLVTDTLVYYYLDLNIYLPKPMSNNDLSFVLTNDEHAGVIDQLTTKIFKDYRNHYCSNYLFQKDSILDGYKEWARNYITDMNKGRISWLVKKDNQLIGFATCSFLDNESEGVLYGVAPEASGAGIYSDMIKFTAMYFKKNGYTTMKVSTQVQNFAVQKVWLREGFVLRQSFNTVHLNSLMSHSIYDKRKTRLSGNKVMDFAIYKPYSLLKDSLPKKHVKKQYLISSSLKVVNPLELQKDYYAISTTPYINKNLGQIKLLVRIFDEMDHVSMFAYYDFEER